MIKSRYLLAAVVLVGCAELPGHDDPRDGDDAVDPDPENPNDDDGTCGGLSAFCDDRSQSQCNAGCVIAPTCKSIAIEQCAAHRDPDECDGDASCWWSSGVCNVQVGIACSVYESQTACSMEPLDECAWATGCTGTATPCYELETRSACLANLGCTWTPD